MQIEQLQILRNGLRPNSIKSDRIARLDSSCGTELWLV
jgi:hypothetical protein